jgi:hypothetical protein
MKQPPARFTPFEDRFFQSAPSAAAPMSIEEELGLIEPFVIGRLDPGRQAHQRRLRRAVTLVVAVAGMLVGAAALHHGGVDEAQAAPAPRLVR